MKNFKIWLADDDNDDFDFFKMALDEMEGEHQLTRVKNGLKLMKKFAAVGPDPDILFMDNDMPYQNGIECLIEIREDLKKDALPVLILTTSSDYETVEKAKKVKANACAFKQRSIENWKSVIEKALFKDWKVCKYELIVPD